MMRAERRGHWGRCLIAPRATGYAPIGKQKPGSYAGLLAVDIHQQ
jgi:hypothetical protein